VDQWPCRLRHVLLHVCAPAMRSSPRRPGGIDGRNRWSRRSPWMRSRSGGAVPNRRMPRPPLRPAPQASDAFPSARRSRRRDNGPQSLTGLQGVNGECFRDGSPQVVLETTGNPPAPPCPRSAGRLSPPARQAEDTSSRTSSGVRRPIRASLAFSRQAAGPHVFTGRVGLARDECSRTVEIIGIRPKPLRKPAPKPSPQPPSARTRDRSASA